MRLYRSSPTKSPVSSPLWLNARLVAPEKGMKELDVRITSAAMIIINASIISMDELETSEKAIHKGAILSNWSSSELASSVLRGCGSVCGPVCGVGILYWPSSELGIRIVVFFQVTKTLSGQFDGWMHALWLAKNLEWICGSKDTSGLGAMTSSTANHIHHPTLVGCILLYPVFQPHYRPALNRTGQF